MAPQATQTASAQAPLPDTAERARAVVLEFLEAFGEGDFQRVEKLLNPKGFSYIGPTRNYDNAAEYVTDLSRVGTIRKRVDLRHLFQDGSDLCAIYDLYTTLPALEHVRLATWFRIDDGRVSAIESFFDAHPYMSMFGEAPYTGKAE